ncbi:hypothetical protein M9Y10_022584 [Tritrichomonas musculus]|uniref:Uncharacterized protein n=1 Tax=Tritrichomonas musculus TaxID=1915356 RepID=A0ABR2KTM3_9EUKA
MQNYGGYYSQYPQGQNQMYQTPGPQSNAAQSNMRNLFGGSNVTNNQANYGGPQMPQAPQQYGYQQPQMPQQNFVFHFDYNNGPPNMNMGPYSPANPPQYGNTPYGAPPMQQKKEDKNDELFNSFDPFNPKPRKQSKPPPQPQQNTTPQQPHPPAQPQIQLIEDTAPKKQDLNAFRSAFASLAAPPPQQQPVQQQPQQQFGYGGQPGPMYTGPTMQAPPAPQIEGFNFVSGSQSTQSPQIEGFNFGSPQQPQSSPFTNQTSPPQNSFANQSFAQQQNTSFTNPPAPQQSSQPISPAISSPSQSQSSKNAADDPFSNFNPVSSQPQKLSGLESASNNTDASQFGNTDAFSFNQSQPGSNSGIQSFNQPQTGSNGGIQSFNQPQTGSNSGMFSFSQPQSGSSDAFLSFNHSPPKSTSGFQTTQPQTGSGSGFAPFIQPQPQAGSTGGIPLSAVDDLFGTPSTSKLQPQQDTKTTTPSAENPFLNNQIADFSNTNQDQSSTINNNIFNSTPNTFSQQQPPQQGSNGGIVLNSFESSQNQQQSSTTRTGASAFGDSFRQAIVETIPPSSQPAPPQPATTDSPKENEIGDFKNIFNQGHSFFEKQEEQYRSQQQKQTIPEGFTFSSQTPNTDSEAPNFSNFVFNSGSTQNAQFGESSFANFGANESQKSSATPNANQSNQEPSPAPFTPFGVSDLQPMANSTFVISGSGDSIGSQPTVVSADPVDESKIPYFAEEEKKMEFETRIKNDSMSVFDPFNPNPQQKQQQQPSQQEKVQNQPKIQEEPKLTPTINASVDAIRNMFGGPSDEQNEEKEKEEVKTEVKPEETTNSPFTFPKQNENNSNEPSQGGFLGGFSSGFGADDKNDNSQNKLGSDIQLNAGLGDNNNNNNEENLFAANGSSDFQASFGRSPEGNPFGFGGFGFDNSFGKGNVFQNIFEKGDMNQPATFGDFFPHHNSEPLNAPIQIENKEKEISSQPSNEEKQPPKSTTPFAPAFDLMDITSPSQNQSPEGKQQQESEKPKEQHKQQEVDFDNPFINQNSMTMFGQTSSTTAAETTTQKASEPFNPFGATTTTTNTNNNLNLTLETQSTFSLSESSAETTKDSIPQIENQIQPNKDVSNKKQGKGDNIFDEIPNDISEIDKSLPEKPPPFVMPTIGDSSSNPFTNVLDGNSSATSNPFTSNNGNKANPFILNTESSQTATSQNNQGDESNPFSSQIKSTPSNDNKDMKDESNPFTLENNKNQSGNDNKNKNDFDDLLGFGFSSTPTSYKNDEKKDNNDFFGGSFNNAFSTQTEKTAETETKEEPKAEKKESQTNADTSDFTFTSGTTTTTTTDSKEANPFSNGFNPFGGDFNPFGAATTTTTTATNDNDNQSGGFTFTPTFGKEEGKGNEKEGETNKDAEKEGKTEEEGTEKPIELSTPNTNAESTEKKEDDDDRLNIVDTLDDDLFDMNSVEKYEPKKISNTKNSDLFGDIHTFPVSNSTSDFLSLKQKKKGKNAADTLTQQSDGGASILAIPSHTQSTTVPIISIIDSYANSPQELQFSVSDDIEDPSVLEIMSNEGSVGKILKKYVKPPENDFYGCYEKDPHPIKIFPKFENTDAAKVLGDFVLKNFGITATFASTSRKQQEEIDVNSIFNVPAASEPNEDDDFLFMI